MWRAGGELYREVETDHMPLVTPSDDPGPVRGGGDYMCLNWGKQILQQISKLGMLEGLVSC